jgi:hypothetical protein
LRARIRFRRYRRRRVHFLCFVLPDSFSAVPSASGPIFMFCAPRLIFGGTVGVGSRLHVLRSLTHCRRYLGRRVPFARFALPDSFSAIPRASGHVCTFCAPELIFGGIEGVGSRLHVLRSRIHFRRYRGHRVPFSCFAPGLIFDGTAGVPSRFHVFRSRTCFRRYRGRQVVFSCFALPDTFSTVP